MADWFKFYCDGLDEPRFRYALRTLSEVCPVWLLILSECCRSKSESIEWTGDEVDLLGWSEKAAVSPGKLNEAITLLAKIRYIELDGKHIRVRKWNDLQSDYCRQIDRKKSSTLRETPRNSEKLRLEERRGEESRSEKKDKGGVFVTELPEGFPKNESEAKVHAEFVGCKPDFAAITWTQAVARGGKDSRGQVIQSFRHHLAAMWAYERSKTPTGNNHKPKPEEMTEAEILREAMR